MPSKPANDPPLPDALRAWRARARLSQSEAARRLRISVDTLQNWESGRRTPRGFALVQLRALLRRADVKTAHGI